MKVDIGIVFLEQDIKILKELAKGFNYWWCQRPKWIEVTPTQELTRRLAEQILDQDQSEKA